MEIQSPSKRKREGSPFQSPSLSLKKHRTSISQRLGFFHLRSLSQDADLPHRLISLRSDRIYTIGRSRRQCEIIIEGRCISRRHCQIFLDGSNQKLLLIDGFFLSPTSNLSAIRLSLRSGSRDLKSRGSLNGVCVNGIKLQKGIITELLAGDEILFGCSNGCDPTCRIIRRFVVERIVLPEAAASPDIGKVPVEVSKGEKLASRAALLLRLCRRILRAADPVLYLRTCLDLDPNGGALEQSEGLKVIDTRNSSLDVGENDDLRICSVEQEEKPEETFDGRNPEKDTRLRSYSDGTTFFLNRLEFMGPGTADQHNGITLPELLHPLNSLVRVFIATFTCDISWFLSCCQVPKHLPVTVACHNAEKCWSARHDSRTLAPYSDYPNLLLVFPPFPDVIAFGKDRKKQGVACHHPKLIVLQREDSIRIIITSANLVSKQWNHVTNTVWWQDFPLKNVPDYSALFQTIEDAQSDFAAQLAGFIATLITDVPSQVHWIKELTKYDFRGSAVYLVSSIPGMHAQKAPYSEPRHMLSVNPKTYSQSSDLTLGSVQSFVVGLSHRFHTIADSNGVLLKSLTSILGNCRETTTRLFEVLLKRNNNIPADANAVSVIVAGTDKFTEEGCLQLGFLPRDVAKWVSPLVDAGFFNFSAFIYPKEALAAAFSGSNMKVQLLLSVIQGSKFPEIARLIQHEHVGPLCSLLASMQRSVGIWRLQEVLARYKWPELLETDFLYGSSSIGTSVNAQFLASFSAAAGKKSCQFFDSEESDPEWGCWTRIHELRNPSMAILFPTIERVKNGTSGIQSSRRLLAFSEKTWQRMRTTGIFHDAIPHPGDRIGHPMHVKVGRRRFQPKTGGPSFGWVYCGSHNFSPAAWGDTVHISPSPEAKEPGPSANTRLGPMLRICNYELGVLFIVPPSDTLVENDGKNLDLDDIVLPFVVPAPIYRGDDRPATAQAIREAVQREVPSAAVQEMDEDVPDEEEMLEAADYRAEEKDEEKVYAEMLWSQVDSTES